MSVIFHDIHDVADWKIAGNRFHPLDFWELMYADDTMIVGNRAREINILLKNLLGKFLVLLLDLLVDLSHLHFSSDHPESTNICFE